MKKLILVLVLSVFVVGLGAGSAMADSLMFPWIVKNTNVTTLVSVVQTSEISGSCRQTTQGTAVLHYAYYYKNACRADSPAGGCIENLKDACVESNFTRPTSQNDIVSFDAGGKMDGGTPLFNDPPFANPDDNVLTYGGDDDFSMHTAGLDRARAFLLVDNNDQDGRCFNDWDEATLYGEALILELSNGAGWGYVAYNGIGGGVAGRGPNSEPELGFSDGSDMQGEVLRSPRWYDDAVDPINGDPWRVTDELESTPTVLLPLNKFQTKMFMTPINYVKTGVECPREDPGVGCPEYDLGGDPLLGARNEDSNARLQFCYDPTPLNSVWPRPGICGTLDQLVEDDCQASADAPCTKTGIWNNDEGPMSSSPIVDVVCTAALNIDALSTGTNTTLLNNTQISYLKNDGRQAWTYVRSSVGDYNAFNQGLGNRRNATRSDMIVGKLEFTEGPFEIGGTAINGEVNDFKWIRNSASLDTWSLRRGINLIIQSNGFGD